ncbi:Immunoglobulin-like domain [Trinorchestia longiramus]|nr:Immunoglobulin-like domain [Trinorchestia longiramus]
MRQPGERCGSQVRDAAARSEMQHPGERCGSQVRDAAARSEMQHPGERCSSQVTPQKSEVAPGSSVELRCSVAEASPTTTIWWLKDGVPVTKSSPSMQVSQDSASGLSLLRVPVSDDDDAGFYQCRARRDERSLAHAHALIALPARPPLLVYRFIAHALPPGPSVSLKCVARAVPVPHILWSLDGLPITPSHSCASSGHLFDSNELEIPKKSRKLCWRRPRVGILRTGRRIAPRARLRNGEGKQGEREENEGFESAVKPRIFCEGKVRIK